MKVKSESGGALGIGGVVGIGAGCIDLSFEQTRCLRVLHVWRVLLYMLCVMCSVLYSRVISKIPKRDATKYRPDT